MAKQSSVQKNLFRQKLIKKFKTKRDTLKSKIKDKNISLEERISYQNKLNDLPRNGSSLDIEIDVRLLVDPEEIIENLVYQELN